MTRQFIKVLGNLVSQNNRIIRERKAILKGFPPIFNHEAADLHRPETPVAADLHRQPTPIAADLDRRLQLLKQDDDVKENDDENSFQDRSEYEVNDEDAANYRLLDDENVEELNINEQLFDDDSNDDEASTQDNAPFDVNLEDDNDEQEEDNSENEEEENTFTEGVDEDNCPSDFRTEFRRNARGKPGLNAFKNKTPYEIWFAYTKPMLDHTLKCTNLNIEKNSFFRLFPQLFSFSISFCF